MRVGVRDSHRSLALLIFFKKLRTIIQHSKQVSFCFSFVLEHLEHLTGKKTEA